MQTSFSDHTVFSHSFGCILWFPSVLRRLLVYGRISMLCWSFGSRPLAWNTRLSAVFALYLVFEVPFNPLRRLLCYECFCMCMFEHVFEGELGYIEHVQLCHVIFTLVVGQRIRTHCHTFLGHQALSSYSGQLSPDVITEEGPCPQEYDFYGSCPQTWSHLSGSLKVAFGLIKSPSSISHSQL